MDRGRSQATASTSEGGLAQMPSGSYGSSCGLYEVIVEDLKAGGIEDAE